MQLEDALLELRLGDEASHRRARVITEGKSPYRILQINAAWVELCGFEADEAVGSTLALLHGPSTREDSLAELGRALAHGHATVQLLVHYTKSRTPFLNLIQVAAASVSTWLLLLCCCRRPRALIRLPA
jgi:hypothetical protein